MKNSEIKKNKNMKKINKTKLFDLFIKNFIINNNT